MLEIDSDLRNLSRQRDSNVRCTTVRLWVIRYLKLCKTAHYAANEGDRLFSSVTEHDNADDVCILPGLNSRQPRQWHHRSLQIQWKEGCLRSAA
jgi:hypothetical protein